MTGTVFDIKEFSVYDGPGMRVTVFLKGCPLKCLWCHNPEGLEPKPQLMVSTGSCINCGKCIVSDCALRTKESCSGCGRCVPLCPGGFRRIVGQSFTDDELCAKLMSYADFFGSCAPGTEPEQVSGGVTFSGGEPLMQADFLCSVLDMLPPSVHKAVQTSGYAPENVFERVLERVDYLFFDIKHTDSEMHRQLTGVPNERIIGNLSRLIESGKPFVARMPLIAGINDSRENFAAAAELLAAARTLLRVELLRYNGAAGGKYRMLGREYGGESFRAPETVDTTPFERRNIEVRVL